MANQSKTPEIASNAILPLELSFEIDTVLEKGLKLTGQRDGEIESRRCPIFSYNGKNLDLLMFLIREFRIISSTFEWDEERQHEEFGRVLGPSDRLNWEEILESIPVGAVYDFDASLETFKANYMPPDARLQQLDFLRHGTHRGFTKTFRTLVSELKRQSLFLRELLNDDPVNDNLLTEAEIKNIVWQIAPESWRRHVTERYRNQHRATLFELTEALDLQKRYADIDSAKKQAKVKKEEKRNSGNGTGHIKQGPKKFPPKSTHRHGAKHKYDPNAKDQKPHSDPNRPCWKANHQNHKWGECFQNPANPNNKLGRGNGSRSPATAYHVHATPPAVVHIPPAPAYPPSAASVISHGTMLSGASMAPSAYYYAPSPMEPVPPRGHGTYDYTDSTSVNPQCYFVHDSRESSDIDYHHLNAPVANDAFFVNNQVEGCNDVKEFVCPPSFLPLQSFSLSLPPSSSPFYGLHTNHFTNSSNYPTTSTWSTFGGIVRPWFQCHFPAPQITSKGRSAHTLNWNNHRHHHCWQFHIQNRSLAD